MVVVPELELDVVLLYPPGYCSGTVEAVFVTVVTPFAVVLVIVVGRFAGIHSPVWPLSPGQNTHTSFCNAGRNGGVTPLTVMPYPPNIHFLPCKSVQVTA